MARGAYKSNIFTRHEQYQPGKDKRIKAFKHFFKIITITINVTIIVIIISFAENRRLAVASPKIIETTNPIDNKESILENYYTEVIGNEQIARLIIEYSRKQQLDSTLLVALMETESNFDPRAKNTNRNGSIDRGLCQLNNKTFPELKTKDFYDPETNIRLACELLRWCFDNANGSMEIALAYYNAVYGNVSSEKVGKTTLNYIQKIIESQTIHQKNLKGLYNESVDIAIQ